MELSRGYKQTAAGVIPEDWGCVPIASLAQLESGHTPSKRVRSYWDGDIPWVSLHDSKALERTEIHSTAKSITPAGLQHSSARLLPAGTVVFSRTATVGKASIIAKPMATSQDFANYICGPGLYNRYLVHLFRSMKPVWQRLMAGSIHNTIYMPVFEALEIACPPLDEQRSIAEAIDTIDALLHGLTRLIAKKRDLKQSAMQQLLTGRTRLNGFRGDWEIKKLSDVVSVPITDGPHLTPAFLREGIPFLSVNNVVDNRLDFTSLRFISREDHQDFSKKCRPQRGDILFGKAASVGQVALIDTDLELNIWSPLALIRVGDRASARFVVFALQTVDVRRQIALLTNSSSQGNIGMRDIGRIEIPVPSVAEQIAIATVLSDMDAELTALRVRVAKTQALKQAMMQQLLTGRIRLVAPEPAHA